MSPSALFKYLQRLLTIKLTCHVITKHSAAHTTEYVDSIYSSIQNHLVDVMNMDKEGFKSQKLINLRTCVLCPKKRYDQRVLIIKP